MPVVQGARDKSKQSNERKCGLFTVAYLPRTLTHLLVIHLAKQEALDLFKDKSKLGKTTQEEHGAGPVRAVVSGESQESGREARKAMFAPQA